jgi:hypothetical protein
MEPTSSDDAPDTPTSVPEPGDARVDPVEPESRRRTGPVIGVAVAAVVVIAIVVALVAGGGDSSPKVSASQRPSSSSTTRPAPPTTVSTRQLTPFSDNPTITCGVAATLPFPAAALSGPTRVERGSSPAAKAFHSDLAGPNSGYFDNGGRLKVWRLATETEHDAYFLGGDGTQRYFQHYTFKGGKWGWANGGSCASTTVVEPDLNIVALNLDDDETVDASTTKVRLQVTELTCTGGAALTADRVVGPQVHVEADRVVITMAARKPADATSKSCVAAQPLEVVVDLGQPLGSRPLLNGNRFPYQPIV